MGCLFHFIPFSFSLLFFFFFCIPEKGKCVQRIGSFACLSITASDTLFSFTRCNNRSTCATRDKLLLNYYSAIDTTAIYCAAAGYISKPMLLHRLSYRNSLPIFIRTINLYQKPSFDEKYLNQFLPIILIIPDRTFDCREILNLKWNFRKYYTINSLHRNIHIYNRYQLFSNI